MLNHAGIHFVCLYFYSSATLQTTPTSREKVRSGIFLKACVKQQLVVKFLISVLVGTVLYNLHFLSPQYDLTHQIAIQTHTNMYPQMSSHAYGHIHICNTHTNLS